MLHAKLLSDSSMRQSLSKLLFNSTSYSQSCCLTQLVTVKVVLRIILNVRTSISSTLIAVVSVPNVNT